MKSVNFLIGSLVFVLDWLTKYWAVKKNLPSLFFNSGSLLFGLIELPGFVGSVSVAILLLVFSWFYFRYLYSKNTLNGFVLIISGAVANLIDGWSDGRVVDFIDIGISTLNLADFAIMGGIALLIVQNAKRKA